MAMEGYGGLETVQNLETRLNYFTVCLQIMEEADRSNYNKSTKKLKSLKINTIFEGAVNRS
jgi:hypothetical protein